MKFLSTLLMVFVCRGFLQAQCTEPMNDNNFSQIHAAVAGMQQGKEQAIRDISSTNCLTSGQIGLFTGLIAGDQARYDYLIFAKPFCSDPQYYSNLGNNIQNLVLRQQFQQQIAPPVVQPLNPQHIPNHSNNALAIQQPQQQSQPQLQINESRPQPIIVPSPIQPVVQNIQQAQPIYYHSPISGYNGRIGCATPMDEASFISIFNTLEKESFDNKKLERFKQLISGKCVSADQLDKLLASFDFENNKLTAARYALASTHDLDNYLKVKEDFTFGTNQKDLENHFNSNAAQYVSKAAYLKPAETQAASAYTGRRGCNLPMGGIEFANVYKSARNESIDAKRVQLISNSVGARCMSVDQVEQLSKLFSFDNYKLDFMKYAYPKTYDIDNFNRLESLFSFDSYKKDFRAILK